MNTEWNVFVAPHSKGAILFEKCDLQEYNRLSLEYDRLSKEEKATYKGKDNYISKQSGIYLTPMNKNYAKLVEEVNERINNQDVPETFNIDYSDDDKMVMDLLASIENENYIKNLYKRKKLKSVSGINTNSTTVLLNCMRQGRSLLRAGRGADVLAQPLVDFYAATAYAYALIVINSPLHKSIDSLKGSHGHTYNHLRGSVDFGGSIPSGTFLDMLCAFPVAQIHTMNIDIRYSVLDSIELVQHNSIGLTLSTLLSMVPELMDFYKRVDKNHQLVHKLTIDTSVNNRNTEYNFYIGDGIAKPDKEKLKLCFKTDKIENNTGSYVVSVDANQLHLICPIVYQDICGQLWYVETPLDGLYVPEICLHYLIISALCNIMRYSPHEWNLILNNKVSPQYALLINRYIRLFETKYPMLIVRHLTNYFLNLTK